jgi:hypothetical protein
MRIVTFKSVVVKLWVHPLLAKNGKILLGKGERAVGQVFFVTCNPVRQPYLATVHGPMDHVSPR